MGEEFKVRAVEFEEKGVAEIEDQLLKEHDEKVNGTPAPSNTENIEFSTSVGENISEDLDDNRVLSYLGKRWNREITSLDELADQRRDNEELPEDVSTFLKYKKETGRSIQDFIQLSKDYDTEEPNSLLFEYYKSQNADLDAEDIKFDIESNFSYDSDYDDEKDIKKKQIAKKKELAKAKKYFNEMKEQYKVPLESRESFVPQEERDTYDAYKKNRESSSLNDEEQQKRSRYFSDKTNELFSDKFEGFGFNISENKKLVYKPAEPKTLLQEQANLSGFISKFLNDDGYLADAEAFHRAISVASNPEKFAKFFYEQGKSEAIDGVSRESKNIDMTRQTPQNAPSTGMQVRALDQERGSRLVIKKR
jgi:hypothetical protein